MWQAIKDRVIDPITDLVFPRACLVCGVAFDPLSDSHSICPSCRTAILADLLESCPRCSGSVGPFAASEEGCPRCRADVFAFDRAIRLGPYSGTLRDVILRMKDATGEPLAETVGAIWVAARKEELTALGCQMVVPVPLFWRKRLVRGYNPAAALARAVAAGLGLPYRDCLRRTRSTPRQTDQTPAARRENVRGAFAIIRRATVQDMRVLLIDDVLTSGSTCSEAAKALRAASVAQVRVAVLAHR